MRSSLHSLLQRSFLILIRYVLKGDVSWSLGVLSSSVQSLSENDEKCWKNNEYAICNVAMRPHVPDSLYCAAHDVAHPKMGKLAPRSLAVISLRPSGARRHATTM